MKERGVSVRVVVGCLLLLSSVAVVSAVPNSWSGLAGNNNWADPGNWTGANFPQDGEDVVISDAAVAVKLTADTAWMSSFTISNSTLICSNWTTEVRATNVYIRNDATIALPAAFTNAQMSNRVYIVCTNFVLDAGGVIDADRKGFAGTYGDGAGGGTSRGGGAGHGGLGAYGNGSSSRGVVYGTASAPVQPGSGGGGSSVSPGAGGGAVRIDAGSGTVTVNGTITADGGPTGGHGGGGSGGSVLIDCETFGGTTNGLISADGGSVSPTTYGQYGNGAGAGGRIAVRYTAGVEGGTAVRFSTAHGEGSWAAHQAYSDADCRWPLEAEWGTTYLPDTALLSATIQDRLFNDTRLVIPSFSSWSVGSSLTISNASFALGDATFALTVDGDLTIDAGGGLKVGVPQASAQVSVNGDFTLDNGSFLYVHSGPTNGPSPNYNGFVKVTNDLVIGSDSWIYPTANSTNGGTVLITMDNLSIAAGGGINAFGRGFAPAKGPGAAVAGGWSSGAGHGGVGGVGAYKIGQPYGSVSNPIMPGSGTTPGNVVTYLYGGGAVRVQADGIVTVNGTILADGGTGYGHDGGGSGGSVRIACTTFGGTATGLIRANGGSSFSLGGGGSGGRMAISYTGLSPATAVRFQASPGLGNSINGYPTYWPALDLHQGHAQMGTLWLSDTGLLSSVMADWLFRDVRVVMPNFDTWSVPSLTVSNCSFAIGESQGLTLTIANDLLMGAGGALSLGFEGQPSNIEVNVGQSIILTNGGGLSIYSGPTNALTPDYGALVAVSDDITIGNGSWICPYSQAADGGSALFQVGNLNVASNGGFNAFGRGYMNPNGPGKGGDTTYRGGGGGHGGAGGQGDGVAGGVAYGSSNAPVTSGSPGGGSGGEFYASYRHSGMGGGAVRVDATGTITLDGTLNANGGVTPSAYFGGGAGGSIYLVCQSFNGGSSGALTAEGGFGGSYGGGGGGGRIAVWGKSTRAQVDAILLSGSLDKLATYTTWPTFSGTVSVTNGLGNVNPPDVGAAVPGTVFLAEIPPPHGTLILVF